MSLVVNHLHFIGGENVSFKNKSSYLLFIMLSVSSLCTVEYERNWKENMNASKDQRSSNRWKEYEYECSMLFSMNTLYIFSRNFLFWFLVNKVMLEISAAQYYEDKPDAKKNFCNHVENMPHVFQQQRWATDSKNVACVFAWKDQNS